MKRSYLKRTKPLKRTAWKRRRKPMRAHKQFVAVEVDHTPQLGETCIIKRIFRSVKAARNSGLPWVWAQRSGAVRAIRRQVFERSQWRCEALVNAPHSSMANNRCRNGVTWETGEMHELQPRGMTGFKTGEISVENSVFICKDCHHAAHDNRRLHWIARRKKLKPSK
jgi:hypothetical protein